jgi:hypothetical protein
MPNSVPFRLITVNRLEDGTPWAASSAALHAAIPKLRAKCSFWAANVRTRARSPGDSSSDANSGASALMSSADAARFRL